MRVLNPAITRSANQRRALLERLQGSLATWEDPGEIRLAYAQSLAVIAYVARQYGDRILYDMIGDCREGKTPRETFLNRIGIDLMVVIEDLERRLSRDSSNVTTPSYIMESEQPPNALAASKWISSWGLALNA